MSHCSVVAQIRTLDPFFATPLLQLPLSLTVDCVDISVRFFCIGTSHFWERRGAAAAGSSPGSLTAGAGDGSVLNGQCDSGEYPVQGLGAQTLCVLSLAVNFIQAFATTNHHRVEHL